jgi:catechol 2,3-dioxygenase-like lactoylglutathione lyase family enzyme
MAVRKRSRRARGTSRKASARSRTRPAPKRKSAAPRKDRRKSERETLRLRATNPIFTVTDLERSIRFYTDVLGFVVSDRYHGSDGALQGVMLKAGVCELGLTQDDWAKGRDRQRGVAVRVWCTTAQDIDALAQRIKARNYPLTQEPHDESFGGRSLTLDDPDGFHLSIYRSASLKR